MKCLLAGSTPNRHQRSAALGRRFGVGAPANGCELWPVCDADQVVVVFDAELWMWNARRADSWTFVSLPADASEQIHELAAGGHRGFGAVRVRATVGGSTWTTSIFPDSARDCYVLPIKRAVRNAESLGTGDIAKVAVELVDL
jgi:hypothetical protein